jgi:hypothetical protein
MADAPNPFVQNSQARSLVLANSISMRQQIAQETITNFTVGQTMSRNIALRNVGMVKKLYLTIQATIAQSASETLTRTAWGPANLLSNVTFSDYANYQRINTTGWHLHSLATVKNRAVFGGAFTNDTPTGFGSTVPVISAPSSITTAQTVYMVYEIPFAYSDTDLTGAVLANVVNANAYLAFTFNPTMIVANTANSVQAAYQSSTSATGTVSSITWTLYQDYLDQLPQQNGQLIAPAIDLATVYGIYNTQLTGLAPNSDNPISYANYRRFLSTVCIYDNAGTLSTTGADVNRWKLQAANMTNIFDIPPWMVKMEERKAIMDNFPIGSYYFSHRDRPIDTQVNGNMNLLINPATVTNSTSQVLIGFEYLALLNQVAQAGSVLQ